MKKIVQETTVYEYEDLLLPENKKLKEKVLENLFDINTDFECYDSTLEEWTKKLEEKGFKYIKIDFSGFCSQGDGASFTCPSADFEKLFSSAGIKIKKSICEIIQNEFKFEVHRRNSRYYHTRSTTLNIEGYLNNFWDKYPKIKNEIEKRIEDLEKFYTEEIININRDIYQELREGYNYLTSEKSILKTIEANNYLFTSDGKIFQE
jgi:hypothetical protein